MSTAIYFNVPAYGHVNPSLAVVAELVRRGETIHYFDTAAFRLEVEGAGAVFHAYSKKSVDWAAEIGDLPLPAIGNVLLEACLAALPQARSAIQAIRPEYLIVDSMCPWGWIAAREFSLPSFACVSTFAFSPAAIGSMLGSGFLSEGLRFLMSSARFRGEFARLSGLIREMCEVEPPSLMECFCLTGDLNFVFTSERMQPASRLLKRRYSFVGPSIAPRTGQFPSALGSERRAGAKLLYVSLGTVRTRAAAFFRDCFAAFGGDPGIDVVMSIGRTVDPGSLGPAPGNFTLLAYAPQLEILSRADAFISHGGMNSVNESLYYGVPLVMIPRILEQRLVASRVAANGAGILLPMEKADQDGLLRAVMAVLGVPRYRERAACLGEELRSAGGATRVAVEMLAFLGSRSGANRIGLG